MTYDHQYVKSLNHLHTCLEFGKEKEDSVFLASSLVNFHQLHQHTHFIKQDIYYV